MLSVSPQICKLAISLIGWRICFHYLEILVSLYFYIYIYIYPNMVKMQTTCFQLLILSIFWSGPSMSKHKTRRIISSINVWGVDLHISLLNFLLHTWMQLSSYEEKFVQGFWYIGNKWPINMYAWNYWYSFCVSLQCSLILVLFLAGQSLMFLVILLLK